MQTEPGAGERRLARSFRARVGLVLAACTLFISSPVCAAGARKPHSKQTAPPDSAYASALATANRFLHAWQTGDLETGMVLLSDRVRHAQNPETFETFFSSQDVRGFEITRGTVTHGRYRFPVVLVTTRGTQVRRKFSEITIVATGKNDWTVDKLP